MDKISKETIGMTSMQKQRVYLSGGFGSDWQEEVIKKIGNQFTIFNPKEHNLEKPDQYWTWDIHFIRQCDIVFAFMDRKNPSGYGLALEVGAAYAYEKVIILVDEKSPRHPRFRKYYKIVHSCAHVVLPTLQKGISYLQRFQST